MQPQSSRKTLSASKQQLDSCRFLVPCNHQSRRPCNVQDSYEVYPFPVYGTVSSGSQTILVLNPCQRLASPEVQNVHKIFPLIVSLHTDYCSLNSETICNIFGSGQVDGIETRNRVDLFLNLSEGGSPVGLDLVLSQNVSSAGNTTFNVGFAGTPSYTPLYANKQLKQQQTIVINIQRDVTVTTYSPKSILSLLGSLSGIFSAFMAISGVISSMIWSRFGVKQDGRSMVGGDAVTVGSTSLQDLSPLE